MARPVKVVFKLAVSFLGIFFFFSFYLEAFWELKFWFGFFFFWFVCYLYFDFILVKSKIKIHIWGRLEIREKLNEMSTCN